VLVDLLLETFGSSWPELREAAQLAERSGFDGLWVNDHLAGSVAGAPHVLECWTVLSALAVEVPRIAIGPLVLNVANRDPGTLAVMAATLQHVSGGRLLMGLGAGARAGSTFAIEQEALGRRVAGDAERRRRVEETIATLRQVWSGTVPPASGFLRPRPTPPIVVAAMGPKMAELAGRLGDGLCVPAGSTMTELVGIARQAWSLSGHDPQRLLVTALLSSWPAPTQPSLGPNLDRLIIAVAPPFETSIARVVELVGYWRKEIPHID
jgi:alkanesulfonate monooxygenase SsuD/methylene tetrahydromethanopterin reductase-like flavin-dependent oxidoreductase (luciferase family)